MSGWTVPVKNDYTKYLLTSNTFYITTENVTDSSGVSDEVMFKLYPDSGGFVAWIKWRFSDWGYCIHRCTPKDYELQFPVTPPTDVKKIWEVTFTTEDITIKCNSLEVLNFIFNNTYNHDCTTTVKEEVMTATKIKFLSDDTATEMFSAELLGK